MIAELLSGMNLDPADKVLLVDCLPNRLGSGAKGRWYKYKV